MPEGYGFGLLGVALFAAGGVLDMLWHLAFGIKAGIDALVSPTHLLLLVGGTLLLASPLRSVSQRQTVRAVLPWPGVLSVTAVTVLAAFFLSYASVFTDAAARVPLTTIQEGARGHLEGELPTIAGLASYLVTTTLLVLAVLWLRRSGQLPPGALTVVVAGVALGGAALTGLQYGWPAVGAVAGAAVAEAALLEADRRWGSRRPATWLGAILPAGVWAGQLIGVAAAGLLVWPVQMWLGTLVLASLGGLSIGLVSQAQVPSSRHDRSLEVTSV